MAWAPPLPATLLSQWTSRRSGGASRGLHAVSRVTCCINRALRLHQPAPLAASVSGDALPGSARTFRSKHPGATLGACPGATRAARRPAGLQTALHYVRPAPVAGSTPPRRRHAIPPGHQASTSRPYSPRLCQGSSYDLPPGATARVASTLIDSVLAATGTWPRLAARLYRPPGATAAWSQTPLSLCPSAPSGSPGPDCVADGRDLTVTAHSVT